MGRLYGAEVEKFRAVRALGHLVRDPTLVPEDRVRELMRRFVWALSDESGAVPFGVPEAMGVIMVERREFQDPFLGVLCGMLTNEEMSQTGAIERGVIWALGQVGRPVAACAPDAVDAIARAAREHPEAETRAAAAEALERIRRA